MEHYFTPQKRANPISSFLLLQEFYYYFLHITQRRAFSQGYTPTERADLREILLFVLYGTIEEIPEAYRAESRNIAVHNANVAEVDYGTTKQVHPKVDPFLLGSCD